MKLNTAKKIMTLNTKEAIKFVKENLNWLNDEEQMFEEATSGNWTNGEYTDEEVDEAIQTVDDNWVREMIEELNTENKEDTKMKYKDMNKHQQAAYRAIKKEFNWLVGGWYNCFQDGYEEEIPELQEAKDAVYEEAMSNNPKEIRFAGEEFCRRIVEKLFNKDEDVEELWGEDGVVTNTEETKEDKTMTREELNTKTVKELKAMAKDLCIEGMSRAKKEELVQAILNYKDAKPAFPNTITKVNMFAFTGMFIGEFEAEVQDGKILVNTSSRGELMFDAETGKEVCEEKKARWANRVEAV